jgi:hypothetical protein
VLNVHFDLFALVAAVAAHKHTQPTHNRIGTFCSSSSSSQQKKKARGLWNSAEFYGFLVLPKAEWNHMNELFYC